MVIKSNLIKEFFIVSNIYRNMSAYIKKKLKQHNIPINETQLNILFLMYTNDGITGEEMLNIGNFALSTLLFNISNLQNASLVDTNENILSSDLKKQMNISENGYELLEKIEGLFKYSSQEEFCNYLTLYENNINKTINQNK